MAAASTALLMHSSPLSNTCFAERGCGRCISQSSGNHCAHCHGPPDVHACFDEKLFPEFCTRSNYRKTSRDGTHSTCSGSIVSSHEQHEQPCIVVQSVEECSMRHQSCNASQPIRNAPPCCSVPTLPWLRSQLVNSNRTFSLDNFALMDVVVKALVADSWVRQEQAPDADAAFLYALHVRYLLARHAIGSGDILNRSGVSVSLRLMMFRGLYDSVRTHGFDWVAAPIPVDRDYRRLDGGHPIALRLHSLSIRAAWASDASASPRHRGEHTHRTLILCAVCSARGAVRRSG